METKRFGANNSKEPLKVSKAGVTTESGLQFVHPTYSTSHGHKAWDKALCHPSSSLSVTLSVTPLSLP